MMITYDFTIVFLNKIIGFIRYVYMIYVYIHTHDIKSTLPDGSLFLEDLGVPWHMLLKQLAVELKEKTFTTG